MNIIGIENINESLSTHYLIYKITNNINGKYYIGQHKTNNPYDNYMGSGKYIQLAESKYGLSNFTKEIQYDFDNKVDMNKKELELVLLSNCFPYDLLSYNLTIGGKGGNNIRWNIQEEVERYKRNIKLAKLKKSKIEKEQEHLNRSNGIKNAVKKLKSLNPNYFKRSASFRLNLSKKRKGKLNPMYGKNSLDFMTDTAIKEKCKKEKEALLGRRAMINIKTNDEKHVKPIDFLKYLNLGYIFKSKKYNNIL